jgi:hypothetical protein
MPLGQQQLLIHVLESGGEEDGVQRVQLHGRAVLWKVLLLSYLSGGSSTLVLGGLAVNIGLISWCSFVLCPS